MKFTKKQIRQILGEAAGETPGWIKGVASKVWEALNGWVDNNDLKKATKHMKSLKNRKNWKLFVSYYKQNYREHPGDVIKGVSTNSVKKNYKKAAFELAAGRGYAETPTSSDDSEEPSPIDPITRGPVGHVRDPNTGDWVPKKSEGPRPAPLAAGGVTIVKRGESCPDGTNPAGSSADGGTICKSAAAPAAPKPAPATAARPRRGGGGVYAKGPKVGQIQQLLLKAFGAGPMQESKELNEVTAKEVLGGKGRVDSMLGKTTLKSINKIPAVAKYFADMGGLSRKNVKMSVTGILNILQQCGKAGFKDWKCKPGGKAPVAAPAGPTPAPAAPTAQKPDPQSRIASAQNPRELQMICKELGVDYKRADQLNYATKRRNPHGACSGHAISEGTLQESKSPLKQKEIKHFGVRRTRLLETLIKKVSK
jgi:hypothetical protein